MRGIKKGDKYLCKTSNFSNFIKGNVYEALHTTNNSVRFIDAFGSFYYVDFEDLQTDFTDLQEVNEIKVNYEIVPSHYDNKSG